MHELAHGLALAHYGRTTNRAGIRLLFIFPYAFVDHQRGLFRVAHHRIAISAAGPAVRFVARSRCSRSRCAVTPTGNLREVLFQFAFAGYVGAFFNVNPFLDRDGYHILSEWLSEPQAQATGTGCS